MYDLAIMRNMILYWTSMEIWASVWDGFDIFAFRWLWNSVYFFKENQILDKRQIYVGNKITW